MSGLPIGWSRSRLGEVATDIGYGFTTASTAGGGRPKLLRITDIQNGSVNWETVPRCTDEPDERTMLGANDIVIARTGATTGKSYLIRTVPERAVFASYLIRVRLSAVVEPDYVWSFMQSRDYWSQIQTVAKGTAQPGANASILSGLFLPVAPLPEQRRIVAKIDSLTGKSRRARDHLDHIPRLVEKYKQAILAAAFRGDLTREWRSQIENGLLESPVANVRAERDRALLSAKRRKALDTLVPPPTHPQLPDSWEWACIDEIASDEPMSIQSGPFGSDLLHSEFTKSGKLVVGIDNVQDGYFSSGSQNRIPDKKFEELIRFRAKPLDVLITVMATIGRVCVLPADIEPAIITKHVYRISVDSRIALPNYIAMGLRGAEIALAHMGANVRGQTRPGLNGSIVKATFLPIPSLAEQAEIVLRIETAFALIDRLAADSRSARKLVDHLDQAVLAKAFKGELVPQDPADEPASALLDRIRAERAAAPKTKRGRKKAA
ncbi:restriction endonuclease subunit S [Gluconobacter cerinus]|uniref:restriction endonuclease subunit S n=1 Tax=Gluconobacter cerinus TaxID=38307 RepID=UPI001B8BA571|nr:restriction endonuclease subunit S [Gluconobacter cerinus]MBS0982789.1 restriction endonuclease subunit S [Gluconobacter cerinus]